MTTQSLLELSTKRDTDKGTTHSYIDVYESLFSNIRNTVKNVLEIGVQTGGSLLMWRDYFPNAQIYGVDTNYTNINDKHRIITIYHNAYDISFYLLQKCCGYFDIIIDDGSHDPVHQQFVAEHYVKLLSSNGILVIEDIQNIDWVSEIIQHFPKDYNTKVLDRRDVKNRWDDILIVAQK